MLKAENTYNTIFDPNKNFRGYLNSCLINQKAHNFWLKHEDQLIKTKTSNFKLHLSCVIVKELYNKRNVNFEEISNINLDNITIELFNQSIELLSTNIDQYLNLNENSNLINIAKSKDFTDYLFEQLTIKYSS